MEPVGLLGEPSTTSFVRGVMAAISAPMSQASAGVAGTAMNVRPATCADRRYDRNANACESTSSVGSQVASTSW